MIGFELEDCIYLLMHLSIFIYFYLKTTLSCTLHDTSVGRIFCMVYSYILRVLLMRDISVYLLCLFTCILSLHTRIHTLMIFI